MSFSLSEYTKIDVPLEELIALPQTTSWFQGTAGREWRGGEGRTRGGVRGNGRGKGEWGREGTRGKLGE